MFDYARDGLNPIKPKYSSVLTIVSGLPAAIRTSETAHSADKHFRSVLQVQKKPKSIQFLKKALKSLRSTLVSNAVAIH